MAGKTFDLTPKEVPAVETQFRRIQTPIPVPESLPTLERLRQCEPVSMTGQPPVVWDRAEGCQVYDRWGNMWLDWSSGVLVTNAGHGRREICEAIVRQAEHGLLHNYCFPSGIRAELAARLVAVSPEGLDKVFLLTTGAETTECTVKLMRTHGRKVGGDKKIGIVSFDGAFHGRTLGAQMIGGSPALKEWIVNLDPSMWQVPFPDGYWVEDRSFDLFLRSLQQQGVTPDMVAGVITETYQGGGASFAPTEYVQALAAWCKEHDVVLTMDEVQAAFGRTGTMFGFEHYGIVPDLVCCGKGVTSGLPLSAVIGRQDLMDQYPPGSMTSTHSGNPICCASALASLDLIEKEDLVGNSARVGRLLHEELAKMKDKYPRIIGPVHGKGLVAGAHVIKDGRKEADYDLAFDIVCKCVEKGLLMFSPVGKATLKICPPLCVTEEQMQEGIGVLDEAIGEALDARG
ncbi:MAG: aspartate aminotransferase family protein [Candidatus Brocadiae bacterium]|nr:aspartate aminotransferase family protein [Candidatus Brocadiia bacterium]